MLLCGTTTDGPGVTEWYTVGARHPDHLLTSNDVLEVAERLCMRLAQDRLRWRAKEEAYSSSGYIGAEMMMKMMTHCTFCKHQVNMSDKFKELEV